MFVDKQFWHDVFLSAVCDATKIVTLDLRLTADAKRTLIAAAKATHRSVSEFVLESALARAQETFPDRQHFGLDAGRWKAFLEALETPSQALPRLKRLLETPSVFEASQAP